MDEPTPSDFAALDENAAFDVAHVDVTGGAAAAEAEREGAPGRPPPRRWRSFCCGGEAAASRTPRSASPSPSSPNFSRSCVRGAHAAPAPRRAVPGGILPGAGVRAKTADAGGGRRAPACARSARAKGVARVGAPVIAEMPRRHARPRARRTLDFASETSGTTRPMSKARAPRSRAYLAGGADRLHALCEGRSRRRRAARRRRPTTAPVQPKPPRDGSSRHLRARRARVHGGGLRRESWRARRRRAPPRRRRRRRRLSRRENRQPRAKTRRRQGAGHPPVLAPSRSYRAPARTPDARRLA